MVEDPLYIEQTLLGSISQGNEEAFRELYELYVPRLIPFVRSLVQTESLVNDVIQQTFLCIWIGRKKLEEVNDAKSYIFKIAANTCYKIFRRNQVEKKVFTKMDSPEDIDQDNPQEALQMRELMKALEYSIGQLSPQRKKIYLLSRQHGLTIPEIASRLGLSVNTVRNTLSSSLEDIRDHLVKRGYHLTVFFIILRLL